MSEDRGRHKILIVDDDRKTVELVRLYLENDGYQVFTAHEGHAALSVARKVNPDLVVLDLMLPKVDGLDVCRQIRTQSNVPIIMLTARTTEEDKLIGLDIGADDYITKPFSPREVLARVRAVLRRTGPLETTDAPLQQVFDEIVIDFLRWEVRVEGHSIHLTPKEFKLLEIMAKQPGQIFSRTELLARAFGPDYEGLERTIDVHVMNLRKKLEQHAPDKAHIKTIYGMGYKFSEEGDAS
ncbi:MAG TPA: response regulator transcription factor [Anaerolineales bacterium]|nr:response regulator transcription factor [Anaerolineales bacterium]